MAKWCEDICQDFEKNRPTRMIHDWKAMKCRWEMDPSQTDPYVVTEKGKTDIYNTLSLLTPGFHSLESQFCKMKACRD